MRNVCAATILALLALAPSAEGRTLTNLQSDIRILTKDTGSRNRYSDSQLTDLANEAQRHMIARTWCLEKNDDWTLSAQTTYYATATDFLAVRRLTSDYLELQEKTPAGLDKSRGWQTAQGTPTYYYVVFSSRTKIGFAPVPATSADTTTIRM